MENGWAAEFWYPVAELPLIHCYYVISGERILERSTRGSSSSALFIHLRLPAKCPKNHPIFLKFLQFWVIAPKARRTASAHRARKNLESVHKLFGPLKIVTFNKNSWDYSWRTLKTFWKLIFQITRKRWRARIKKNKARRHNIHSFQ